MAEPLTCDRCMSAPASLLLVLAKAARDHGKGLRSGARVLLLRCEACLRGEVPVLERGGRAFTVLAVTSAGNAAREAS
jgi:hypothetical protein